MARIKTFLLLLVGLAMLVPALPSSVIAAPTPQQYEDPPQYRRTRRPVPARKRRVRRVRRRRPQQRVIHHYDAVPTRRPRQPISDPRTSFYIGAGGVANIVVEGDDQITQLINTGGGLELFLGYRAAPMFALELGGLFTFHDVDRAVGSRDFDSGILSGVTGDLKFFFLPSSRRIEPFLQVGGGGYFFQREGFDNQLSGGGFQVGGGVDIRLSRMLAIGTRVLYRGLFLDNADDSYWYGDPYEFTYMSVFTFSANLQFHF